MPILIVLQSPPFFERAVEGGCVKGDKKIVEEIGSNTSKWIERAGVERREQQASGRE